MTKAELQQLESLIKISVPGGISMDSSVAVMMKAVSEFPRFRFNDPEICKSFSAIAETKDVMRDANWFRESCWQFHNTEDLHNHLQKVAKEGEAKDGVEADDALRQARKSAKRACIMAHIFAVSGGLNRLMQFVKLRHVQTFDYDWEAMRPGMKGDPPLEQVLKPAGENAFMMSRIFHMPSRPMAMNCKRYLGEEESIQLLRTMLAWFTENERTIYKELQYDWHYGHAVDADPFEKLECGGQKKFHTLIVHIWGYACWQTLHGQPDAETQKVLDQRCADMNITFKDRKKLTVETVRALMYTKDRFYSHYLPAAFLSWWADCQMRYNTPTAAKVFLRLYAERIKDLSAIAGAGQKYSTARDHELRTTFAWASGFRHLEIAQPVVEDDEGDDRD